MSIASRVSLSVIMFYTSCYAVLPLQTDAIDSQAGPVKSSNIALNDEAQVRLLAHTVLRTLYSHHLPDDLSHYRDNLRQIEQHFDTTLFEHVVETISNDDLMKLAEKYQMTITEKQSRATIDLVSDSADHTQWRVTTEMTLYYVKDQIEIVKPVRNILVIQKSATSSPVYKVVSFATSNHGRPQMIDYQALRQSNCPKRPVSND